MEPTRTEEEWRQLVAEAYTDRNLLAQLCARLAYDRALDARWTYDPEAPDWPVVLITLPTGQISYHIPRDECIWEPGPVYGLREWDGHTTEQKRERIRSFLVHEVA